MAAFRKALGSFAAVVLIASPASASTGGSLMRRERPKRTQSALQAALEQALAGEAANRLFTVEASVRPAYEAFPKNAQGQIPLEEIFPAIVRNYFAKEHGWLLRGLEPPALTPRTTEVQSASILSARAPAVATALADLGRSGHGLSLSDVVGVIATLEHLVIEDSVQTLRAAYDMDGLPTEESLDEEGVHQVLRSYMLLFRYGTHFNMSDLEGYSLMRARAEKASDWNAIVAFEQDALVASGQKGPKYGFADVAAVVRDMAQKYGKWQNDECLDMKAALMHLVREDGSGRVPFEAFHAEPAHPTFQFTETAEYLKQVGILEDAADGVERQSVLLANYVLGPSNCIAPSTFHMVCCVNECEVVISDIETRSQAPTLQPDRLLAVVAQTASSTQPAPRDLDEAVAADLRRVAEGHEGVVPLHSAGFKKWLHSAFPNECPFPTLKEQAAEDAEMAVADKWLAELHECTRLPEWHPESHARTVFEF